MSNDKLAEALLGRIQEAWENHSEDGRVFISMRDAMELCEQVLPAVIQQAHVAEAAHPQPAQDASKYQELLMAVEKKFPGESRHDTALRYIRQAELRSCEPKCDSSMAKESGR